MSIDDWLKRSITKLEIASIGTARLDALVLLEDASGKDRAWLLAHPEFELDKPLTKKLNELVARRANHEPLAYIRNKTEFYGREFFIDHRVLEPRPESETMIDLLKSLSARLDKKLTIADVGTGSGALAITTKLEIPSASVLATDIDEKCLVVARKNAKLLGANVNFFTGDLLAAIPTSALASCILLANLPYVPNRFTINPAAMNEPRIAIFGGPDGLDIYRQMFAQIDALASRPSNIFTESMPPQHAALAKIASDSGYKLVRSDDFIQQFEPS